MTATPHRPEKSGDRFGHIVATMGHMIDSPDTEQFKALALLAGLDWQEAHELPNGYWPDSPGYAEVRAAHPWLLLTCERGTVTIGWRKRVLSVSWTMGKANPIADKSLQWITHGKDHFHAYDMVQALTFLTAVVSSLKRPRCGEVGCDEPTVSHSDWCSGHDFQRHLEREKSEDRAR